MTSSAVDGKSVTSLQGAVFTDGETVNGYVFDELDLDRQFVVELLLDGWPIKVSRAEVYDSRSQSSRKSKASHGFVFALPPNCSALQAEVRVANLGYSFAEPIDLTLVPKPGPIIRRPGSVKWAGGLRLTGWVDAARESCPIIRVDLRGEPLCSERADHWTTVQIGDLRQPKHGFDIRLPPRLADGCVHEIDVKTLAGEELEGSPIFVVAFEDGLEEFLISRSELAHEALRGKIFDALIPRSIPFSWVDDWLARFPIATSAFDEGSCVSVILLGEAELAKSLSSLEDSSVRWVLGVLPLDEDGIHFQAEDLADFLQEQTVETEAVVFARTGSVFHPDCLARLAGGIKASGAALVSADVLLESDQGPSIPLAFASLDPERLLEQGYIANLFALTREAATAAAEGGANNLFDLVLSAYQASECAPHHVSGFLASCPRLPIQAATKALQQACVAALLKQGIRARTLPTGGIVMPAIRVSRDTAAEGVSVLLPVRNYKGDIQATVEAVRTLRQRHRIDLHVIDMASTEEATLRYLSNIRGQNEQVERSAERINVARALNKAASGTRGRFLCFLESGSVIDDRDWFEELVTRCSSRDVAAAGPLLTSTEGAVCAAGLVLSASVGARAVASGFSTEAAFTMDLLSVARSCSALPLPGMVIKRGEFAAVGGFDSHRFGTTLHSVDLSLRLARNRKRLIFTPHTQLKVSARSQLLLTATEGPGSTQGAVELSLLRSKWQNILTTDPFYSSSFNVDEKPYSALAWPPRTPSLHAQGSAIKPSP